jgi:hypothetical protein
MPIYHNIIDDIMIGTHKGIRRFIRGVDEGLTITHAWLTVKENITKTDAQALFQKAVTGAVTIAGTILDDGEEGIADIIFYLYPADTIRLNPRRYYPYDVVVQTSDNKYYPVDEGAIITRPRVGRVTGV